jgi:integrating conjugative element protein (TIGR03757 family)
VGIKHNEQRMRATGYATLLYKLGSFVLGGMIELDEAPRIEAELSAALPADPGQATAIVKRRLSQGGADLQRRIATAYQGVADAWSLGITTIPAVVVDQRYVVYGEPDVARAIARIEQHRRAEP